MLSYTRERKKKKTQKLRLQPDDEKSGIICLWVSVGVSLASFIQEIKLRTRTLHRDCNAVATDIKHYCMGFVTLVHNHDRVFRPFFHPHRLGFEGVSHEFGH